MECEIKYYYRVKYALVCTETAFSKSCRRMTFRAYFIILNKIDELDGTNEKLLEYYQKYIEK